jgi:hypothetical protein
VKFVLFVEGHTEKKALPDFLKKWLDGRLEHKVGVKTVRSNGWQEMVKDLPVKVPMHLHEPGSEDTIAVIGLLDLYGPTFYPDDKRNAHERYTWAKKHLESLVGDPRFRMHFAVQEVEAWLLSDPGRFPHMVQRGFPGKIEHPEEINFDQPPSRLLDHLYYDKLKKPYKKVVDGQAFFAALDPDLVYAKCPYFAALLDDMLSLAKQAGG